MHMQILHGNRARVEMPSQSSEWWSCSKETGDGWASPAPTSQCLQDDEIAGTRGLLAVEGNATEMAGSVRRKA